MYVKGYDPFNFFFLFLSKYCKKSIIFMLNKVSREKNKIENEEKHEQEGIANSSNQGFKLWYRTVQKRERERERERESKEEWY